MKRDFASVRGRVRMDRTPMPTPPDGPSQRAGGVGSSRPQPSFWALPGPKKIPIRLLHRGRQFVKLGKVSCDHGHDFLTFCLLTFFDRWAGLPPSRSFSCADARAVLRSASALTIATPASAWQNPWRKSHGTDELEGRRSRAGRQGVSR